MTFLRAFSFTLTLGLLLSLPLPICAQSNVQTLNPTFTTIDVPGAGFTAVIGINTAGDVVGDYGQSTSQDAHGFRYSNGIFTYIDYPEAFSTVPTGINDSGLIVGYEGDSGNIHDKGFQYDGATFTPVRVGQNTRTFIWGINNAGDLPGGAGSANLTRAFVKQDGSFKLINFPGSYSYAMPLGSTISGRLSGGPSPAVWRTLTYTHKENLRTSMFLAQTPPWRSRLTTAVLSSAIIKT